jgi:dTDP-4-amino-4,6-dideoxygalactose transaminase
MPVPLLDINRQHEPLLEELLDSFQRTLATSRFIKGPEMEAFEQELATYVGTERAVGCASGTDALMLALQALGVDRDHLVVTVPFTFFSTAGAVSRLGARPVFVDILPDTYNMDPSKLSEWLGINCSVTDRGVVESRSGRKVSAILPVHLFGQPANMTEITSIAEEWGLPVVEDACQSVGAEWKEAGAGSMGLAGCFSFFPSKNLGALGDGGAVTTDDPELADRMVRLREHGGRGYLHSEVGWNSRLDALQAGFLRVKLRALDSWHQGRRGNASFYDRELKDLSQVITPKIDHRARSVYNQYTLRAERRDELVSWLREKEIGCAVYYPLPLHLQECFHDLGYGEGDFPVAEAASGQVVSIPVFGELTESELNEVCAAIRGFYQRNGGSE